MSISQNFPNTRPSLNLNFARSKTLDPRITFSRPQTGNGVTYVGEDGLIKYASADEPRFDHDPVTGECLGLLIEEQRSNLLSYSEDFTNNYWSERFNTTINLVNDSTNPLGLNQVNEIVISDTSVGYITNSSLSITSGATYTTSYFARFDNSTTLFYYRPPLSSTSNVALGNFDGISIEVLQGDDTIFDNYGYEIYPNNWIRLWFTWTADQTDNNPGQIGAVGTSNTDPLFVGAQLEVGAFPTSYIPRPDSSTATRNPDSVSMTGDNFSDWYNPSEGSIFVRFNFYGPGDGSGFSRIYEISDGTLDDRYGVLLNGTSSNLYESFAIGGTGNVDFDQVSISFNSFYNHVSAFKLNDYQRYINVNGNIEGLTDESIAINNFTPNVLKLGGHINSSTAGILSGHISKFSYYPTRLSNDNLQTLTK